MRRTKFGLTLLLLASGCAGQGTEQGTPAQDAPAIQRKAAALGTVTTSDGTGWTATGRLASDRLLHTATRLQDGRVLVFGGYNPTAELYDPATGTWSRTGDAPANYRGATATLLPSGQVLVTGANDAGVSAALYDPASGTWTATGGLTTPRYHHGATLLQDGRVLVMGGEDGEYGGNVLASAELYDPASGSWTAVGGLNVARTRHTATVLRSGEVLVAGGQGLAGSLTSAELFNVAAGTWTPVGDMATARTRHTATLLPSGQVLVTGGGLDGEPSARAELFDPQTQTWTATASMLSPRHDHAATLMPSGQVLVTGGFDNTTGIQTAAELYDAARGTWTAMPSMGVARYQHTATLLANGRVLVAGGFSTGDQASSELFSTGHLQVLLDEGASWQLVNVSGANADGDAQPYNSNLYLVHDDEGVANAPLPDGLREELAQDAASRNTVYFLDQKVLDEIRLSQAQGSLTPALAAIAQDEDPAPAGIHAMSIFSRCDDKATSFEKRFDLVSKLDKSRDLGDGFKGTLKTSGGVHGGATAKLDLTAKRFGLFGKCIPYGARFDKLTATASAGLDYGASLEGTLSYSQKWDTEIFKPGLFDAVFTVAGVPVVIGGTLPISIGLDLDASVTGAISYNSMQSTSGSFTATCTLDGCSTESSFTPPSFTEFPISGSLSGRIQPSVWAQAGLRVFLYSEHIAYAQVGLRPYARGDLWGYAGNNCGDRDGDGLSDNVENVTFDLDWQLYVTGEASVFSTDPKKWDDLWHTERNHLLFKDLSPGNKASVFQPLLTAPPTANTYELTPYKLKLMCWPYGDAINYRVAWDDGTADTASGAPGSDTQVNHEWQEAAVGGRRLTLTALSDAHGRSSFVNGAAQRTIQVNYKPRDPAVLRRVVLDGRIDIVNGELIGPDKKDTVWIQGDTVDLDPAHPTQSIKYTHCVGGEVLVVVDVNLALKSDGSNGVDVSTSGKLFEDPRGCSTIDLDATGGASMTVARDSSNHLDFNMTSNEITHDYASLDLTVTNNQRPY